MIISLHNDEVTGHKDEAAIQEFLNQLNTEPQE